MEILTRLPLFIRRLSVVCLYGILLLSLSTSMVFASAEESTPVDITSYFSDDETVFSVFYLRLDNTPRNAYIYNSKPMRSASMIKVFIYGFAMQQVKEGTISLTEPFVLSEKDMVGGAGVLTGYEVGTVLSFQELLELMIIESDNTATNIVMDRLGMDKINEYISYNGYKDTILQRKMMDFQAVEQGYENYTSVADLGLFYTRLYDNQCVDKDYDAMMIDILKQQQDTEALPTAFPYDVVAHKTGELIGVYNDGGIVYGKENRIIVVLTDDYQNREKTIDKIIDLSRYLDNIYSNSSDELAKGISL